MDKSRVVVALSLATALAVPIGCSKSDSTATKSTSAPGATTAPAAPSSDGGDGGAATSVDICKSIPVSAVSAIVGGTVKMETDPTGGCRFPQEDLRAPTAGIGVTIPAPDDGDFERATTGVKGAITGETKELTGVGDKAVVIVGTTAGGSNAQGSALALVDGSIIQVTLSQGNGLANADVEKMTGDLLKLAVSKL